VIITPIIWKNWLTGDVYCEGSRLQKREWRRLRLRLALAARRAHRKSGRSYRDRRRWHINSGFRAYAEQKALYDAYLRGEGNLAAEPGSSNHEKGKAADVSRVKGGIAVGRDTACREAMKYFGLCLPVEGEAWHTEIGTTWRA
jgi:hypothetical protein